MGQPQCPGPLQSSTSRALTAGLFVAGLVLQGRAFRTLHQGVKLAAKGPRGLPRARRADVHPLCIPGQTSLSDRGSFIEHDPTKPACAHFWKHPQAFTLFFISWPLQNASQETLPQDILLVINKLGQASPLGTGNWKWLILEKQLLQILSGYK